MVDMQANKLPTKLTIYSRSILVIASVLIVFFVQACSVNNKRGAATPDRVIEQYLLALENKDANLMQRLAPEQAAVEKEVISIILKHGGYKIQDRQISYTKSKPSLWNAKVRGFYIDRQGIKKKFEDSIVIEYQSKGELKLYAGRWYLLPKDEQ